ncbi:hypothetical protein KL930_003500 [Ogataea haglerorum]|uniref:Uncharacterized protein n=1 Tax=Ogataea haglerorum TaxID=1937702 RepID=A0AAN6D708_9ASCO|nr:uncharacterized protein KL911_003092 [Ogataea haglerorum]KAG7695503.1 hypothetical protein KL915_002893 [Ogataea haglerorum]KAG7695832.1 hypothetical protein KL951_003357 [Ogataea haglerorum]KAG7705744.1 hypothetical protein KL914_003582 [Ogataea haglerorum]KAG7707238.1 hypothetical protein KL950_002898 [Ogataea haglerorum]KAG7718468.1 hypothetical protein KL913_002463 [Ogataea haglerorum]
MGSLYTSISFRKFSYISDQNHWIHFPYRSDLSLNVGQKSGSKKTQEPGDDLLIKIMWKAEVLERLVFDEHQMVKAYAKYPSIALKYYPNARYCKKLQLGFASHDEFSKCIQVLDSHGIPTQQQEKARFLGSQIQSQMQSQIDFGSQMAFSQSSQVERKDRKSDDVIRGGMVNSWSQPAEQQGVAESASQIPEIPAIEPTPNLDFLNSIHYTSFQDDDLTKDPSLNFNSTSMDIGDLSTSTKVATVDFCALSEKELYSYILGKLKDEDFKYLLYKLDRILKK